MGAGEVLFFSCANVHLLYVGEMKRERERETAKKRPTGIQRDNTGIQGGKEEPVTRRESFV